MTRALVLVITFAALSGCAQSPVEPATAELDPCCRGVTPDYNTYCAPFTAATCGARCTWTCDAGTTPPPPPVDAGPPGCCAPLYPALAAYCASAHSPCPVGRCVAAACDAGPPPPPPVDLGPPPPPACCRAGTAGTDAYCAPFSVGACLAPRCAWTC